MEVTFIRELSTKEKEEVRQLAGFYRGIAVFRREDVLGVEPKEQFSEVQFINTIKSLNIPIKNVNVKQ
ncbi:hypothetical protein QA612_01455 [Evansella sp. AB-P1]|uniref:hypothetical protein n=1 Tax=Evansella sp. AB-P1 TaxID=3037653 RepID=UPI00241C27DF|nr:hypothetical protein [Evansella sp. AB-P1]MDG5786139.1 hypothetical protein [Evansella sp. AB-P1]